MLSIFFRVVRKVSLSVLYMGKYRRWHKDHSISNPQLETGFSKSWNLCLNLCSGKWLWTNHSLVINLIALGLTVKKLLADRVINLRILFQTILRLPEFLIFRPKLCYCIMADRKKYLFKKSFLFWRKEHFAYF